MLTFTLLCMRFILKAPPHKTPANIFKFFRFLILHTKFSWFGKNTLSLSVFFQSSLLIMKEGLKTKIKGFKER